MIDYSALLFDPVYNALGVPANLTTPGGIVQITVIDETRAKSEISGLLEIKSVGPAACARVYELTAKGVDRSEYDGSPLAFNDGFWVIRNHDLLGSPNGEDTGQVRFFLKKSNA